MGARGPQSTDFASRLLESCAVSHIRPEDMAPRHRRSACRRGRHDYGKPQHIGAGITRQVCDVCASVTIDLTSTYEPDSPVVNERRRITSLFPGGTDRI